ncbi:endoplasmic reticulum-Golgi intermediate compartment protein 1 isoform X2 [Psammomys obesus]|uniref:endoplasmic reticulum-Golgi intermediate compartment protein 1 isoform X2 n=1 Tax=Psammomys obesus TaxID=48139 RepID=UPI002452EE37|nr:endoplasmic reticulum-Golgi intermediate compartment protein 1 isoform X2 [Psammomys obesus]
MCFFGVEERVLGNRPSCRSQQATVMWEVIGLVWGHSEWGPLAELPCDYQEGITWGSTSSLLKPSQDSRHQTLRIPRSPREKVPGNFHVSTHSATAQPQNPDMTHIIHKLSFGDTLQVQNVHGAFNALGGADRLASNPLASHDYILKIVPTVYEDKSGKRRYSYQYTVANKEYVAYSHTGRIIPAIWFRYDLSPITVKYTERRQPLYRFITTICAIIGGTFTVAGILDSCIFTASEAWKKIQLGKIH